MHRLPQRSNVTAMSKRAASLLAIWVCLAAPGAVHADQVHSTCGIRFSTRADLRAKLRQKDAKFFSGRGVVSAFTKSPTALTLWWLTKPKSPAFPAVACSRKEAKPGSGFVLMPAEGDCGGANISECRRLEGDIHRAKF